MTVNERLFVSGLLDLFDKAVARKDTAEVISILKKIDLSDTSIAAILDSLKLKYMPVSLCRCFCKKPFSTGASFDNFISKETEVMTEWSALTANGAHLIDDAMQGTMLYQQNVDWIGANTFKHGTWCRRAMSPSWDWSSRPTPRILAQGFQVRPSYGTIIPMTATTAHCVTVSGSIHNLTRLLHKQVRRTRAAHPKKGGHTLPHRFNVISKFHQPAGHRQLQYPRLAERH